MNSSWGGRVPTLMLLQKPIFWTDTYLMLSFSAQTILPVQQWPVVHHSKEMNKNDQHMSDKLQNVATCTT
jgi:hypothetical protein